MKRLSCMQIDRAKLGVERVISFSASLLQLIFGGSIRLLNHSLCCGCNVAVVSLFAFFFYNKFTVPIIFFKKTKELTGAS